MYITNETELLDRIEIVIKTFAKGKKAVFARAIGVNERYVARYIQQKRGDWFMGYLKNICVVYPTLSEQWLYTGEGEMLVPERQNPIRSIVNKNDFLIGDLLWEYFGLKKLDIETVIKKCEFDETFYQVMESSRYPTFTELEALYNKYGINITYLFTGKADDIQNKAITPKVRELETSLAQSESANKELNAKLIHALEENSELHKELRCKTKTKEDIKKRPVDVSGKKFAKDTPVDEK